MGNRWLFLVVIVLGGCASQPAPVEERSVVQAAPVSHTVRKGDTLYAIARRYRIKVGQLRQWNRLTDHRIYPGQVLHVVPPAPSPAEQARAPMRRVERRVIQPTTAPRPSPAPLPNRCQPGGSWQWPSRATSARKTYSDQTGRMGIEIHGQLGQAVRAAAAGQVIYSGPGVNGYRGDLIILRHNDTFLSIYARNQRRQVEEGAWVKAGQLLATMGRDASGRAALHFEISCRDKTVDPTLFLP